MIPKEIRTKNELLQFLKFPEEIYKKDNNWVEPLLKEQLNFFNSKNPLWDHTLKKLWVVYENKKLVGRIAGFIDKRYNKINKKKVGYFGFFECYNNLKIAKGLTNEVEKWLKSRNIKFLIGPINGSIQHEVGFLTKGFGLSPEPLMSYSKKYYLNLVKNCNFQKDRNLFAFSIDLRKKIRKSKSNVNIRSLNTKRLNSELRILNRIINSSMLSSHHWQFVPSLFYEFSYLVKDLVDFCDKDLILIAEIKNKPVGIVLAYPDFNKILKKFKGKLTLRNKLRFALHKNKIRGAKIDIIAILPKYAHKDVGKKLMTKLIINLKNKNYSNLEYSWVDEENIASIGLVKHLKGYPYKKYRVFKKILKSNK